MRSRSTRYEKISRVLVHGSCSFGALLILGCAGLRYQATSGGPAFPPSPISLEAYSQPFGHAPVQPDLREVFLSLPDELAPDMPLEMRNAYIKEYSTADMGRMFDPEHRFAEYYNDYAYNPIQLSSIFYVKLLPSSKYHYVVVIHMVKPSALDLPPAASNTFVLAPSGTKWMDITAKVLPKAVDRDWYFQPVRIKDVVETGPYEHGSGEHWGCGERKFDLVWREDHFAVRSPRSGKFSQD